MWSWLTKSHVAVFCLLNVDPKSTLDNITSSALDTSEAINEWQQCWLTYVVEPGLLIFYVLEAF